jgi:hypothetical protein
MAAVTRSNRRLDAFLAEGALIAESALAAKPMTAPLLPHISR